MKNVSRRWFIGGAASFGALAGCRLLSGSGLGPSGKPNLTIGVLSDIHINGPVGNPWKKDETLFVSALEWFRDRGVDGVVVAGDMANCGFADELMVVGDAWRRVFPNDRAPDGRPVEKLFVSGNHDMGGLPYARFKEPKATEGELEPRMIRPDPSKAWRAAFGEDHPALWMKSVRGYTFIGANWIGGRDRGKDEAFNDAIPGFYAAHGKEIDPSRPFFHIQHPHPKDTCYGPWAWGRDVGLSTRELSRFPNAIALSGHSHYPLTDERSVWQGAFTSVGTGCLRYAAFPHEEFANESVPAPGGADCQVGMLWRVYDDCIVMHRREFGAGLDFARDWVLPLPAAEPRPFAFAERARKSNAPRFAADAKLTVKSARAKMRKGKDAAEEDIWELAIPACVADPDARVFRFTATARAGGVTRVKRVFASGCHHVESHAKVSDATVCRFAKSDFADGTSVAFSVEPVNCFGRAGAPLMCSAS